MSKHVDSARPFPPGIPWGLFRFETPEAGPPAPEPVAETAEPVAETTPEPQAAFDPSSWEFQAAVANAVAQQVAGYQGQPEPEGPQLDPYDDNFGQQLYTMVGQAVQQAIQPLQATQEAQFADQGRAEAMQALGSFTDLGEFNHDEAFTRAQDIFSGYLEQYGPQYASAFAQQAVRQAAEQQAVMERKIEERGIERYKKELADATNRPASDPGVTGAAGPSSGAAKNWDEWEARMAARGSAGAVQI